jgi:hypothetical protein
MAALSSNVFADGRWYGPSYPEAGDPPADSVAAEKAFEHDGGPDPADSSAPRRTPADPPPPKTGHGAARSKWADYARANGVAVGDEASREDIIAACQAANVRTD